MSIKWWLFNIILELQIHWFNYEFMIHHQFALEWVSQAFGEPLSSLCRTTVQSLPGSAPSFTPQVAFPCANNVQSESIKTKHTCTRRCQRSKQISHLCALPEQRRWPEPARTRPETPLTPLDLELRIFVADSEEIMKHMEQTSQTHNFLTFLLSCRPLRETPVVILKCWHDYFNEKLWSWLKKLIRISSKVTNQHCIFLVFITPIL